MNNKEKNQIYISSFYNTLKREKYIKMPEELKYYFNTSKITVLNDINDNDNLLYYLCSQLELNEKEKQCLCHILKNVKLSASLNMKTIIAIIIYYFFKKTKKKINVKDLAKVCFISCIPLYRNIKKYTVFEDIVNEYYNDFYKTQFKQSFYFGE